MGRHKGSRSLHPEETKRKQSESQKKSWALNEERRNNLRSSMLGNTYGVGNKNCLGRHLTEEHKQKFNFRGHTHSEESRKKLSVSNKEAWAKRPNWHHKEESNEKNRLAHLGKKNPKSFHFKEIFVLHRGKKWMVGKHLSEETKHKLSVANLGKTHDRIYKPHTEETKKKMSEQQLKYRQTPEGQASLLKAITSLRKISKPQKELYEYLKQLFPDAKLEYLIQTKETWRFADIAIPSLKIDFEYDGYFAHGSHNPTKDQQRDKELANVGWATFRINNESLKILSRQRIFVFKRLYP